MKEKGKGILICVISFLAILSIIGIISTNISRSVNEKTSISE